MIDCFKDMAVDDIKIKPFSETTAFGDKSFNTAVDYKARIVGYNKAIKNARGEIIHPSYKIFIFANLPSTIHPESLIVYNSIDYDIIKFKKVREEDGTLVAWVIFI